MNEKSDARYHARIPSSLKEKLRHRADERDSSMNDILVEALEEYFDESYRDVALEYLARIERKFDTANNRNALLIESFGLFLRAWFQHHPPVPDDEKRERGRHAKRRFDGFVDTLEDLLESDQAFRKGFETRVARPEQPQED